MAFDINGARQAGYTDAEISDFLSSDKSTSFDVAGAQKAGYSPTEIVDFVGAEKPKGIFARAKDAVVEAVDSISGAPKGLDVVDPVARAAAYAKQTKTPPVIDNGLGGGVMNRVDKNAQIGEASTSPASEGFRRSVGAAYDAASPEQRKHLESLPSATGDLTRERAATFEKGADAKLADSDLAQNLDTRWESRARRLAREGMDGKLTESWAKNAAARGYGADNEMGAIGKTDFDFDAQKKFNDPKSIFSNPGVRAAVKGYEGYRQGLAGLNQSFAEVLGADEYAARAKYLYKNSKDFTDGIGESKNYGQRMFEGAVSSIALQLPALIGGTLTGSESLVLGSMFAQSFGQEYAEGRSKGQSIDDARARAGLFGLFEVLGEKPGLGLALKGMRGAVTGMETKDVATHLAKALVREIPGEQLTTLGQFMTDKLPGGVGLHTEAGMKEYLQQAADTLVQTVIQGGMMTGGGAAISKGMQKLDTPERMIAREINNSVNGSQFTGTDAAARAALNPQNYDPATITPSQTVRPPVAPKPDTKAAPPEQTIAEITNTAGVDDAIAVAQRAVQAVPVSGSGGTQQDAIAALERQQAAPASNQQELLAELEARHQVETASTPAQVAQDAPPPISAPASSVSSTQQVDSATAESAPTQSMQERTPAELLQIRNAAPESVEGRQASRELMRREVEYAYRQRDADKAADFERAAGQRSEQQVAQASAMTNAQGFDVAEPTAMQLAIQAAQTRRRPVPLSQRTQGTSNAQPATGVPVRNDGPASVAGTAQVQPDTQAGLPSVAQPRAIEQTNTKEAAPVDGNGIPAANKRVEQQPALTRKRTADMSKEEAHKALLTNQLSGLPNKTALEEHVEDRPDEHVMFGDIDDFKAMNEKLTHPGADKVLAYVGAIKADLAKQFGINPFHLSGDEFVATHTDPTILEAYGKALQETLANSTFKVTAKDGSVIEQKGVGFSYGVARDLEQADKQSLVQKDERKRAGFRVGTRRIAEGSGERRAVDERDIAGRQGDQALAELNPDNATEQGGVSVSGVKKPLSRGDTIRQRTKLNDPFLAFLAKNGISQLDRADTGNEKGRLGNRMVPGYGPVFRSTGLRLDELALKAVEDGHLTQADIDDENDTGGTRKLADLIQRAIGNKEVIRPETESKPSVDDELQAEAYKLGIDTVGKSTDDVYDAVILHHKVQGVELISDDALQNAIDAAFDAPITQTTLSDQELDEIFGQSESTGRTQETASASTPTGSIENRGQARDFSLESESADEGRARLDADEKRQADERTAEKAADDKAKADAEVGEFKLTGSNRAADVAASQGQTDIFSQSETTKEEAANLIAQSDMSTAEQIKMNAELRKGEVTPDDVAAVLKSSESKKEVAPGKIEDFGEHLEGAKKDLWQSYKKSMTDDLPTDAKDITLSKHFPAPNYESLIEAGVDMRALAAIKAMRDEIPSKPKLAYKLSRWGELVREYHKLSGGMLDGQYPLDLTLVEMRKKHAFNKTVERIEFYAELGYPAFKNAEGYKVEGGWTQPGKNGSQFAIERNGRTLGYFDTREQAIDVLRGSLSVTPEESTARAATKLDIYRVTTTGDIVIGKKVAAGKYIDLKTGFKSAGEARDYLSKNQDDLQKILEQKKDVRPERRGINEPRAGRDYRAGENATPEKFAGEFGFRGVQFGNYVEQSRRPRDLNNAYDALQDMAHLLGIPNRAVSLNGSLGLAFGARGRGGVNPAAAHYEAENVVINLTKVNGAGSLGHEWWHALDNYFSRSRGNDAGFVTDSPRVKMVRTAENKMVPDASIRPEVLVAYKGVVDAISASELPKRSGALDGRRSKDYWSTMVEMTARAFETYLISKAKEKGESNDYLANIVDEESHNKVNEALGNNEPFPFPTAAEEKTINPAFDKLFSTLQSKETDKGTALFDRGGLFSIGMEVAELDSQVNKLKAGWKSAPKITIVQSVADLPFKAPSDARGAYHGGKVYLVADNLNTAEEAQFVLFHETLGHAGLRGLFGDALTKEMNTLALRNPAVWREAAKWRAENTDIRGTRTDAQWRAVSVEEVLADMAGANTQVKGFDKFLAAMQKALRAIGLDAVANWMENKTGAEVLAVLADAKEHIEGKQSTFGAPQSLLYKPVFAVAGRDAARFVDQWETDDGMPLYYGRDWMLQPVQKLSLDPEDNFDLSGEGNGLQLGHLYHVGEGNSAYRFMIRDTAENVIGSAELEVNKRGDIVAIHDIKAKIQGNGLGAKVVAAIVASSNDPIRVIEIKDEADEFWTGVGANGKDYLKNGTLDWSQIKGSRLYARHLGRESVREVRRNGNAAGSRKADEGTAGTGPDGEVDDESKFSRKNPASTWSAEAPSKMDDFIYTMQDKQIDTRRTVQAIRKTMGQIDDNWNPYLQEEMFHGRSAKQVQDFLGKELKPLLVEMQARGIEVKDFEEYLHMRHAEERNNQIAKINPDMQDGGAGVDTADARTYLAGLNATQRKAFGSLAKRVDAINKATRQVLIDAGLETTETIKAWEGAYQYYVPLQREEGGQGVGQGYSVRGSSSKRAMGSKKEVINILANLASQRERTIVRAEKNRVSTALYGLAITAPNPEFWQPINPSKISADKQAELIALGLNPLDVKNLIDEPMQQYIDPRTGLVAERVNPFLRSAPNVLSTRVNGEDRYVFFNEDDERAVRMVKALKNLDADQLGMILSMSAKVTRYFSSINTQYNPIFGVVNLTRDVQGAMLNLSTTAIAGKQAAVLGNTLSALRGIYIDLRNQRAGKPTSSTWAALFEEFQNEGGQTGFRNMFSSSQERADDLTRELKMITEGKIKSAGRAVFDWLADYNSAMENAVRLASYRVAKESGMTNQQAASLAKNLTVNFNRKGQVATQAGALYAFFNASVQGTTRLAETLRGPAGKKIITGGLLLGAMQALALAAAGFDDDEPPEFIRSRNIIIPTGNGKYITIPMPLGFNLLPNMSRIPTEFVLSGFKEPGKRIVNFLDLFADTFNPIGNAGFSLQTIAPTVIDPFAAISENRDWTGKPIAKADRSGLAPTPGHTRAKDTASAVSKALSYWTNIATGGTKYQRGAVSPTPDQLDYLIAQATGGVGREAMKVEQTVASLYTGEDLPMYKIPLVGRFYGNTKEQAGVAAKFYDNIKTINGHEDEIKGRRKDKGDVAGYVKDNPDAMLVPIANNEELELAKLKKRKREMLERDASKESIKILELQIAGRMQRFNDRVKSLREKRVAEAN